MTKDKWQDTDIEELLKKAPKIQDNRSKEDVLFRLKQNGVFNELPRDQQPAQRNKRGTSISIIVASVALLFVTIIGAYFLTTTEGKQSNDSATSMDVETAETTNESMADTAGENEEEAAFESSADARVLSVEPTQTAIYDGMMGNITLFPIGLTAGAESIPITFLITEEQMAENFLEQPTQLQLYEKFAPLINEQALGFDDYHPYRGEITETNETITHIMPVNHQYDLASATMYVYFGTLQMTFGKNYSTLINLDETGKPITFDQAGEPSEPSPLGGEMLHYSYALFQNENGPIYLAPNNRQLFASVKEALEYMPVKDNDVYQPAILDGVTFKVEVEEEHVIIRFNDQLDLAASDATEAMRMIEAILLTAAGFNYQVRFENLAQTEWGGFDFTQPIPMPRGANAVFLDYFLE